MDPIIAEGPVRVRDVKKWKSRWVVLSKPSPVADCLTVLAFKSRAERQKGARPRSCARLQEVCGVSAGLALHAAPHVMAVSCPSLCLLLAFERRDLMSAWEARLRYGLGEAHSFAVSLAPGSRLEEGAATLHCVNQTCALTRGAPPRLLARWNLPDLRRYGAVPGGFVFEAGSRCGAGAGVYFLSSAEGEQMHFVFDCVARGLSPSHAPFGIKPALPDEGGGESRRADSVNKETQELEMRLSLLSLSSGDGSPASSLPSSSSLSSQPSLSDGRSTTSGLSDDASLPGAGSALSISSSASSYNEPRGATLLLSARPGAADGARGAAAAAAGAGPSLAGAASSLLSRAQLSSLESGIGSGSLDSSCGSFSSSSSSGSCYATAAACAAAAAGAAAAPGFCRRREGPAARDANASANATGNASGSLAATSNDVAVVGGGGGAAGERPPACRAEAGADKRARWHGDATYSSPRPLAGQGCSCPRCRATAAAATTTTATATATTAGGDGNNDESPRRRRRAFPFPRPFLCRQPPGASASLDVPPRETDPASGRDPARDRLPLLGARSLSHDAPPARMSAEEFDWLSLLANQEVRRGLAPRVARATGAGRAATLPGGGAAAAAEVGARGDRPERAAAATPPGPYLTFEEWRRATLEPQRRPRSDEMSPSCSLHIVERAGDREDLEARGTGLSYTGTARP